MSRERGVIGPTCAGAAAAAAAAAEDAEDATAAEAANFAKIPLNNMGAGGNCRDGVLRLVDDNDDDALAGPVGVLGGVSVSVKAEEVAFAGRLDCWMSRMVRGSPLPSN